jgi:hypothetical protein
LAWLISLLRTQQSTMISEGSSNFLLKARNDSVAAAVELLYNEKQKNEGRRLPYGLMQQVILDLETMGVVTDRDRLNYLLSKLEKKKELDRLNNNAPTIGVVEVSRSASCSTLTDDFEFAESGSKRSRPSGGRPSGSTFDSQRKRCKKRADCINEITSIFATEFEAKKLTDKKTSIHFLTNLIEQKWEEYDLQSDSMVSEETIRTRVKRGNIVVERQGSRPVLPDVIEKVIADVVVVMSKIRHPLCVHEIVAFANSLIEKSEYQEKVFEWKSRMYHDLPSEKCMKLGYGWWRGFKQRFSDVVAVKRGEKFSSDRSEWSKYNYIKQMYDAIYENLVKARIAVTLPEPVFLNADGNIVDNPEGQLFDDIDNNHPNRPLGLPCETKMIHPEYLLFFDETGCNTNQKKDGHYGGQKFACGRGMTPKQICSTRDRHFTVLGITASTGDPVLCVVIFASDKKTGVNANWAEGIDITVNPVMDENGEILLSEVNFGQGKYFPSGPQCCFRGKTIPYLPLSSPSGGITGELLVEILQWLDKNGIYERVPGGPEPFLVLDGHESRLSPVFVDYITDPQHIWHVNLGIPHATSYWQVGDSSEQNGHFKQLLSEAKKELIAYKIKHNLPIALNSEDIIPLVNKSWHSSFANIRTNRKAIAVRGWNPLNRNLLLHKEIKISDTSESTNTGNNEIDDNNSTLPFALNSTTGKSGQCFQALVQHCLRHGGIERNQENLRNGESIQETFQKAKRLSSAVMIRRQIHEVNDTNVVDMIKGNRDKVKEAEKKALRKRRLEILRRIATITKLRLTKPSMADWNMKDCREYIGYKKRNADGKMPGSLTLLRQRCAVIDGRSSPDCSVHESDDDDFDDHQYNDAEYITSAAAEDEIYLDGTSIAEI